MSSPNKDAAVALAHRGFRVFPCNADKTPKGPWASVEARSPFAISGIWKADDLPGFPIGKHGMVVVDCDRRPNGPDGVMAFDELCKREGLDCSHAFVVTTPSGGLHFYFRTETPYGNSSGSLPPGIDVRGKGGYVIAPGAVLPDGRAYRLDHGSCETIPLLPEALAAYLMPKDGLTLPDAVLDAPEASGEVLPTPTARDRQWAKSALASACDIIRRAPKGERNTTLNNQSLAIGEIAANHPDEWGALGGALLQAALDSGLDDQESRMTIASGFQKGVKNPRKMPSERQVHIPLDGLLNSAKTPDVALVSKPIAKRSVSLLQGSEIEETPITWLWDGYLPQGKLTLLAGAGGTGKSTLAFSITSTITTAGRWPDGTHCNQAGNVLIWSSEDDPADTIKPRLMAVNADPSRYGVIQGTIDENGIRDAFDAGRDMDSLRDAVKGVGGIRLLIIDPIVTAVTGDMHKANDVRRSLQAIVDFAAEMNCAVLGITHFAKGTAGKNSAERVIGSQAFAALARMVLVAAKEEESDRRVFTRAKSNNSVDSGGFSYTIEAIPLHRGIIATRVVWGEALEGSSRSILAEVEGEETDETSQMSKAQSFLIDALKHGPVPSKELMEHAREQHGISAKTCRRAKDELGIQARKAGMTGGWLWQLSVSG